jgi:hypothetical protein
VGYCFYVFPWLVLVFPSVAACKRGCVDQSRTAPLTSNNTQEHKNKPGKYIQTVSHEPTPKTTYRHQLRLTGYFHGHTRIILDHGKDVYHYLEQHIWVPELIQLVLPYNQEYKRKTHKQESALATVRTEN